jgi:hypothetical protein
MRGNAVQQLDVFSYVSPEQRVPHDHPLRPLRVMTDEANGTAERDATLVMLEQIPGTKHVTVGGDKAYDTADFLAECRNLKVMPRVAQNLERPGGSAIDARTTQHPGYAISQRKKAY